MRDREREYLHSRYLTEGLGMGHSQRSPQLTTDRDQILDEIVLVRIGHLDCDPLPPIDFGAVVEAPDKHCASRYCRSDDWRQVPDRRVRLKRFHVTLTGIYVAQQFWSDMGISLPTVPAKIPA